MQNIWPFETMGRQDGPILIFLHGFLGSNADWQPIARQCAKEFWCIMPDLPGHGQNVRQPLSVPLNFDSVVAGLCQLITELSQQPVNLVGYSMGGRVALYTATKFPHLIRTLTLEGASPGIVDESERIDRAALDDQRAEQLNAYGIEVFIDNWYDMGLFKSIKQYPELLAGLKVRRKQNAPQWAAKVIAELSPGRQQPVWDQLSLLPMPVYLLAGALDPKYAELQASIAAQIPNATTSVVPGCGHNVHLESPNDFAKLLLHFLAQSN